MTLEDFLVWAAKKPTQLTIERTGNITKIQVHRRFGEGRGSLYESTRYINANEVDAIGGIPLETELENCIQALDAIEKEVKR